MKGDKNLYVNLRNARIAITTAIAVAIFAVVAAGYDIWLCRWQIIPAALTGTLAWIILWLVVTAVGGRIYCSSVCPMGTLFDVFGRAGHRRRGYFYSRPHTTIRRIITLITLGLFLVGFPFLIKALDPSEAYNRIAISWVSPIIRDVTFSAGSALIALATVAISAAVAMRRGRLLCNTICPVGTVLAEISRFSVYHIDINTDKCTGCGLCTARCKAECIDPSAHTVDAARCVVCFNCTAACPTSAITYRRGRHRLAMPMMELHTPASSGQGFDEANQSAPCTPPQRCCAVRPGKNRAASPAASLKEAPSRNQKQA